MLVLVKTMKKDAKLRKLHQEKGHSWENVNIFWGINHTQ
jgi:hypothetical protein